MTLKTGLGIVQGRWKRRCSIDHIYDFILVCQCKYSFIMYRFRFIWRWIISWPWNLVRGHLRSFKLVPFESLGAVSCSPSIVTMAVSLTVYEIFSVRVYRDLKNWVRSCSRSLKVAPFDRPYTTVYWSAIVSIPLSGTFFELVDVEWYHDLEIWVRGHSTSFKPVPCESLGAVSYSPSIVTMALCCIVCKLKRYIGRKSWFFSYPLAFNAPVRGVPVGIFQIPSRLVRENQSGGDIR